MHVFGLWKEASVPLRKPTKNQRVFIQVFTFSGFNVLKVNHMCTKGQRGLSKYQVTVSIN